MAVLVKAKTPPFGLQALSDRIAAVESETGERLARVETKVDVVIDLMRQEREDRHRVATEQAKTERTRISSRAKVAVAAFTAIGAVVGAIVAGVL